MGTNGGGPFTGRLAYWASDFLQLGGYDQEAGILGMGSEDDDMRDRLQGAAKHADACAPQIKPVAFGLGVCLPNSDDPASDRGSARIANCDPEAVARIRDWTKFCDHNRAQFRLKLSRGRGFIRNITQTDARSGQRLEVMCKAVGAFFCELRWPDIAMQPAPLMGGTGAAAEPRPGAAGMLAPRALLRLGPHPPAGPPPARASVTAAGLAAATGSAAGAASAVQSAPGSAKAELLCQAVPKRGAVLKGRPHRSNTEVKLEPAAAAPLAAAAQQAAAAPPAAASSEAALLAASKAAPLAASKAAPQAASKAALVTASEAAPPPASKQAIAQPNSRGNKPTN